MRFESDQLYIKSPEEMADAFRNVPEAIGNTVRIAESCNVELSSINFIYPNSMFPATRIHMNIFAASAKKAWSRDAAKPRPARNTATGSNTNCMSSGIWDMWITS